jgi:hypothetical protein
MFSLMPKILTQEEKIRREFSEAKLTDAFIEIAELAGFLMYHTHDSRRSQAGFPDWTLIRNGRLVFVELKKELGKTKPEQELWLEELNKCTGVEAYLWRPSDLRNGTMDTVLLTAPTGKKDG